MKTDSEILRDYVEGLRYEGYDPVKIKFLLSIAAKLERIEKGLSDKEIINRATELYPKVGLGIKRPQILWYVYIESAKWYRDKIKQLMK